MGDEVLLTGHSIADASGVILEVDGVVSDCLGRPGRELAGMSYIELTHPADRARNVSQVEQLRPQDRPAMIRKRYLRPDGESVWAHVTVSLLKIGSDAGRLLGTLAFEPPEADAHPFKLWRAAQDLVRIDAVRRDLIGADLSSDHGWLILLQLYLAEAEGRSAGVAAIASITGLPVELVSRWIEVMRLRDLAEPCGGADGYQLTLVGVAKLERILLTHAAGERPQ